MFSRTVLHLFHSLVELLFPRLCLVCGNSLVKSEKYICSACLADFPFSDREVTLGAQILDSFPETLRPIEFHALFYYNRYSNYRNLIYAVKYESRKNVGIYLGRMLGLRMKGHTMVDCIVPVPLHPCRERKRGFNQARQIALGVSEVLGIEVLDNVVVRVKNNASQTGKDANGRRSNVENIFQLRKLDQIEGKHILVIDDIVTTGATVGACLYVLAAAKGVRFSLACLARTEL